MANLGIIDFVHLPALDWQAIEDVDYIKRLGLITIGEIDVTPTVSRLKFTFEQSKKYTFDGVYIGVLENLFTEEGALTTVGEACREEITNWSMPCR